MAVTSRLSLQKNVRLRQIPLTYHSNHSIHIYVGCFAFSSYIPVNFGMALSVSKTKYEKLIL